MAQDADLIRRVQDLAERCERTQTVTHSSFLTPAEQYDIQQRYKRNGGNNLRFGGGCPGAERQVACFVPDWFPDEDDPFGEILACVKITAGFGTPGHRDYLGSVLGLGIRREWIGDILIFGDTAYIVCLKPVNETLLSDLDHVSRYGVRCESAQLSDIPVPEKKVKVVTFTVQSPRFDTVVGAVFGISRSHAVKLIAGGAASLNYAECTKNDATVNEGDIISVRGYGKAKMLSPSGQSRKGRTFLSAERYL